MNPKAKALQGKTIQIVRQMTDKEASAIGWFHKPTVIQFTDGTLLIPQSDPEGNNGGAMAFQGLNANEDFIC